MARFTLALASLTVLAAPGDISAQSVKPRALVREWSLDPLKLTVRSLRTTTALPSGIVVLSELAQLHFVDTLQRVKVSGRKGEGPGEFNGISTTGSIGDTVWAADRLQYRVSMFGADGRLVRTFPTPKAVPQPAGSPRNTVPFHVSVVGVLHQDHLLLQAELFNGGTQGLLFWEKSGQPGGISIIRTKADGTFLNLVTTLPPTECKFKYRVEGDGDWDYRNVPFCARSGIRVSQNGQFIMATYPKSQAPSKSILHLAVYRPDGSLVYSRDLMPPALKISKRMLDSVRKALVEAPNQTDAYRSAARSVAIPAYYPALAGALVGNDGSVWVGFDDGTNTFPWHILDAGGKEVNVVTVPAMTRLGQIDQKHLWAIMSDDDDLPYLARYRVP